jgi:dTDP-4-dehydrorhamnose reductase
VSASSGGNGIVTDALYRTGKISRMRLFVTGGNGYLGRAVVREARALGWPVTAPGSRELDVRDADAVARALAAARPDAVVHTAYRLDGPDQWSTNVDGAAAVARASAGTRLLHLSSDVVFDGERAGRYREEDVPAPVHDYGRSKAEAERLVAAAHPSALIVRTSLLYGGGQPSPHERRALDADVSFFTDEHRSPVQVGDLADALIELAALDVAGPLHVAGADDVSRYEFARLIVAAADGDPDRLRSGESGGIGRPRNCTLDSSRARALLRTRLRGVREVLS